MQRVVPAHPDREHLEAFGLGMLGPAEASEIERHVADYADCCRYLEHVPNDSFIALVRSCKGVQPPTRSVPPPPVGRQRPVGFVRPQVPPPPAPARGAGTTPAAAATDAAPIPKELADHPRYRVLGLLGRGGMGAVYKAEHKLMQRTVALKLVRPDLVAQPRLVERFGREVNAAARLSHPNIVAAYDAEQAGELHFLIMEFVEGTDLAQRVAARGPLPVEEACEFIRQAALGLQHAHELAMIHRDIKPQNLMLTSRGQIKILDFGLARFVREHRQPTPGETTQDTVLGTPDFMAPE